MAAAVLNDSAKPQELTDFSELSGRYPGDTGLYF
jgi:hypothetical protein